MPSDGNKEEEEGDGEEVFRPTFGTPKMDGTRCSTGQKFGVFASRLPPWNELFHPPPPPPLPQTQLHLPRPQRSLHHRLTFWGVRGGSSSYSSHLFSLPLPFLVAFPSSSPVAAASPGSISIFSLSSYISRFDLDLLQESLHLPVCNYAKGKWVMDHKKLLYSGHGCKQCLSSMWSCRMTKCIDYSYEKVSWQPKDCQMEEFEGYKFLKS
ncbi:unnamed protein product [Malus baccata var. baccata]